MRHLIIAAFPLLVSLQGDPPRLPKPLSIVDLPAELREISGLTEIDANTVACLQDEAATLYMVNLDDGTIRERHPFGPPGDMEGLTRVGDYLFALRSDGLLFHLRQTSGHYALADSFLLDLPYNNFEGLAHDPVSNLVLVAPKDNLKGSPALRDKRTVFAFDPATGATSVAPVLTFSVGNILRNAQAHGMKLPVHRKKHGNEVPAIKFRMSSIAVQPATGHYFILSAVDRTLLVLDRSGAYSALYLLDKELLPQPEGITFLSGGDLLISTEGKDGPPRIARYHLPH